MTELARAVIHVIDDDASLRKELTTLLRGVGYEACGYTSVGEFLVRAPHTGDGCILLDVAPGSANGPEVEQVLLCEPQHLPIVLMSAFNDVPTAVKAMKAGAADFLLKPFGQHTLLHALDAALRSDAARATPAAHFTDLTEREQAVLNGIMRGLRNKVIASQLKLSERTIKSCRAGLMRRFGARSFAELLRCVGPVLDARTGLTAAIGGYFPCFPDRR